MEEGRDGDEVISLNQEYVHNTVLLFGFIAEGVRLSGDLPPMKLG